MKKLIGMAMLITTILVVPSTSAEEKRNRRGDDSRYRQSNRSNSQSSARAQRSQRRNRRNDYTTTTRRTRRNDYSSTTYRNNRHSTYRNYRSYRHRPSTRYRSHTRRWNYTRDYFSYLDRSYIYSQRWVRYYFDYADGYYFDDYPYYVYNGYRHRYSHVDTCDYQLVDSWSDTVERNFSSYTCSTGYDLCANLRDDLNEYEYDYRYFCAESYNSYDDNYYY